MFTFGSDVGAGGCPAAGDVLGGRARPISAALTGRSGLRSARGGGVGAARVVVLAARVDCGCAGGGDGEQPQGGAFAAPIRSATLRRRRLRCLGGRPRVARRRFSASRSAKESATRRLRAAKTVAANSASGA